MNIEYMKNLIYSLFLFVSFYCTGQDSIRVAGYGSMSNLPPQPSKKGEIAHFEFSHLQKKHNVRSYFMVF